MMMSEMVTSGGWTVMGARDTAGGWMVKAGIWMMIGGTDTAGRLMVSGGTAMGVKVTCREAPC
jgi:hypothetical protein